MASFGKIYTKEGNPRTTAILAVAKANGLNVEVVEVDTKAPTPEFLKTNPSGKIPAFEGTDGYAVYEAIAVAIYLTSQNEKTTLLGKTKQDYAAILKWMSYFNMELFPKLCSWYRPLLGWDPYNKKSVDDAAKASEAAVAVVESHLLLNTFLVGERITLADLFAVGLISRGFQFFYDTAWRAAHPNVSRWFATVYNQPIYSSVAAEFKLLDTPVLTNVAPKKEEKPKAAPKPAAKPAAKEVDEEDEKPAEPKPKHPLEALPRATFPLDEWKRYYSNHEEVESLKWFWENVPFTEYSIWKVQYKYNDELTMTFMSNNLIGGFNNRLEASRKYLFGSASVYGENNDSIIEGAFVIRGDDYVPVFDVAPDYESYSFTKLNPQEAADKAFLESMWKWDQPVVVNGKEYKHASGKVFK